MSRGLIPFFTSSTILFPDSLAIASFFSSTAKDVPQPVRDIPRVSVRHAIVLAVKSPEQLPAPGQAAHSTVFKKLSSAEPTCTCPIASKTDWKSISSPLSLPASMAPPVTISAGMFILPAAMSIPGVTLSQLDTPTQPSMACPSTMTSQQSDMTSLEMREYLIPL